MKNIKMTFKKIMLITVGLLLLCIILVNLFMFTGVMDSYITDNFSHIITVENIDSNVRNNKIQQKPLILDDGTEAAYFAECQDISHTVYIQAYDSQDTLYLDNGDIICTYPEGILQKDNNNTYKAGYLLSIGQKWKSIDPMNNIDQPTRRHISDYVFKVDIVNKKLDVLFESKAKERILYADFETIITYYDGVISYYDSSSGNVVKTMDATFMQKRQKYTVRCIGEVLTVSTKNGLITEIIIK